MKLDYEVSSDFPIKKYDLECLVKTVYNMQLKKTPYINIYKFIVENIKNYSSNYNIDKIGNNDNNFQIKVRLREEKNKKLYNYWDIITPKYTTSEKEFYKFSSIIQNSTYGVSHSIEHNLYINFNMSEIRKERIRDILK